MEPSFFQKLLKSPITLIAVVILFSVILHHVWGMTGRLLSFYNEKKELETKISELQKKNEEIGREMDYTKTAGFLEREGKARLNLKKPGEEVAVIVEDKNQASEKNEQQTKWQKFLSSIIWFFKSQ